MTYSEIFKIANDSYRLADMKPFTKENFIENTKGMTFEIAKGNLEKANLDSTKVMISNEGVCNYWYIDGLLRHQIFVLEASWLVPIALSIKEAKEEVEALLVTKQYAKIIRRYGNGFEFDLYFELYDLTEDKDKYQIFINIYTLVEYGFSKIEKEKIEKIFSLKNKKAPIKALVKAVDENGYVTIYRGEGLLSASIDDAYSWTTNLSTALFFARRFTSMNARLYTAKIHLNDIVDYVTDRGEFEILLLPKNLTAVQSKEMTPIEDIIEAKQIADYKKVSELISPRWFFEPRGIHGVLHTKRVLMLVILLGKLIKVKSADRKVLMACALLHDIGRTDDSIDDCHGRKSTEKTNILLNVKSALKIEDEAFERMKFIIKNHSLSDEVGLKNLEASDFKSKAALKHLLFIFKDADNLDRVRINDLNLKYLRNEEAKELTLIAWDLYNHLK